MPVLLRDAQNAADCVVVLGSTNKYNRRPPPCQPRPGSPLATNRIIQHAPRARRSARFSTASVRCRGNSNAACGAAVAAFSPSRSEPRAEVRGELRTTSCEYHRDSVKSAAGWPRDGGADVSAQHPTLGLDLGTQGVRAVLLDPSGATLGHGEASLGEADRWAAGRHEQDPAGWWSAAVLAVRHALAGRDGQELAALAIA